MFRAAEQKEPKSPSTGELRNQLWYIRTFPQLKGTNYRYEQRQGWISKPWWTKEARYKRASIIYFYLHKVLEQVKLYGDRGRNSDYLDGKMFGLERSTGDFLARWQFSLSCCSSGYVAVCICQNSSKHKLRMCAFCMLIIHLQSWLKSISRWHGKCGILDQSSLGCLASIKWHLSGEPRCILQEKGSHFPQVLHL